MKMNNLIVTINDNSNYGNRLQNYALSRYLNIKFNNVKSLWHKDTYESKFVKLRKKIKCILKSKYRYNTIRENNIKKFTDKYFDINYDVALSPTLNESYSNFIVGSDQVWNPLF